QRKLESTFNGHLRFVQERPIKAPKISPRKTSNEDPSSSTDNEDVVGYVRGRWTATSDGTDRGWLGENTSRLAADLHCKS
ncbi:unnamed protein product, partial [Citrullus colocynthis]